MKIIIKKILLLCLVFLPMFLWYTNAQSRVAPTFEKNFSSYFTQWKADANWDIVDVYVFSGVSADKSFKDNIRCLFYPNSNNVPWCGSSVRGGALRWVLRYVWYVLVVLFIILSGIQLVLSGWNSEKLKPAMMSLIYILIWSILFFGCVRILWSVLKFETVQWTEWLVENLHWNQGSLLFFILSFLKALAFAAAILMMVIHGFKMMSNADKADKAKAWIKWLLNVIVALVIIKIIDYVYYIAQLPDIVERTTDLIIEIARIIWFIIWALMVIMLLYAGFLAITDQWSSENMKKVKNIIVWILVSAIVIFALLLIIYEVFNEFA